MIHRLFSPFRPAFSRGTMKQVVPAPQAKLRFFWGNRKDSLCGQGKMMANLFGRDRKPGGSRVAGKQRSAAPPGRRRCRQPAVPARTAAEKGVSEPSPHGNRRNDEGEVEKGGAVVSPPSVEQGEGQRADGQMTGRRRGSGRRLRVRKGVWVSGVTADTEKKEPPAVGLSKPDASVGRVGREACV